MQIDDEAMARILTARDENTARKLALGRGPEMTAVHTFTRPVGEREVRLRWLVPTPRPRAVLVYLHGGGWVLGSIDTFDRLGRELARRCEAAVLMVDYAKAPEQRFPAAVEDAWASLSGAAGNAPAALTALGTPLETGWPLLVGGDSAGGNLAAVLARRAVKAGMRLDGQVLIYPVTDSDLDRPGYRADPAGRARLASFWDLYAAPQDRTHPDAAPLRAPTLSGQAPALVVNAEHDALNDEITAYADRLEREGVQLARYTLADAEHAVMTHWDTDTAAGAGLDVIADWIRTLRP